MNGFARSSNPYLSGTKPKEFFGIRNSMIKKEKMLNDVNKHYYPKKDIVLLKNNIWEIKDPRLKELFHALPWIIAISILLASIF